MRLLLLMSSEDSIENGLMQVQNQLMKAIQRDSCFLDRSVRRRLNRTLCNVECQSLVSISLLDHTYDKIQEFLTMSFFHKVVFVRSLDSLIRFQFCFLSLISLIQMISIALHSIE